MIIVVAITNISALIFTDINIINTLRYWRIAFLLSAAVAGLLGLFVAVVVFVWGTFTIRFIGTHEEYSKIDCKKI